jgi:integrase/recombinase XerD
LHGYAEKTQTAYIGAVRGLARHYHRTPEDITQEEVRSYFLYLVKERGVANSTLTLHLCGIKFFFENTLKREWTIFDLVRPRKRKKLPVVLSHDEVKLILSLVRTPVARMALTVIYACGLRFSEGIQIKMNDIDSKKMQVWVRNGKGGKDRGLPLPERLLELPGHKNPQTTAIYTHLTDRDFHALAETVNRLAADL